MLFNDRRDAGRALAQKLSAYLADENLLVLALPRGGVPVAYEVARALDAPLDVFIVRKLGVPGHEEYAMGAIASGGVVVSDRERLGVPQHAFDAVLQRESAELARREELYRHGRPALSIAGHSVILVDDGLATGSSMKAAIRAVRNQRPKRIVVAVPVAAGSTCAELRLEADDVICAETPHPFRAVGPWYGDFSQTSDSEVEELLDKAWSAPRAGRHKEIPDESRASRT
jgi:putative phosphoribosyl transferase